MSEYKSKFTGAEIDGILEQNNPKVVFSGVYSAIVALDTKNDYFGPLTIQASSPKDVASLKAGDCVEVDGMQTKIVELDGNFGFFVTAPVNNGIASGFIATTGANAGSDNDLQVLSAFKFARNLKVVDNLTTDNSTAALSATQGKVLNEKIAETEKLFYRIPGKFRNITNRSTANAEIGSDNVVDFIAALKRAGDTESNTTVFIIDSDNIVVPVFCISSFAYTLTYLEPAVTTGIDKPYSVIRLIFLIANISISNVTRQELVPSTSEAHMFDYDFFTNGLDSYTQAQMDSAGITSAVWNGIKKGRITKLRWDDSSGNVRLFDCTFSAGDGNTENIRFKCISDLLVHNGDLIEEHWEFLLQKNADDTYDETYWYET